MQEYFDLLMKIVDSQVRENMHAMDYRCLRTEFVSPTLKLESEYDACKYILHDTIAKEINSLRLIEAYEKDYKECIRKGMDNPAIISIEQKINEHKAIVEECERRKTIFDNFRKTHGILHEDHCDFEEILQESKIEKIKDILCNIGTRQVILFTNHDYIYTMLKPFMVKNNITFRELDGGNINKMDSIINAFKNNEFSVLLADSSMYSCGMNLENTNDIIFVHKMDDQKEKQVIGRAHRYGREGSLKVCYVTYIH
uniref:Helicase C-terminal domain-containing protein n=1 Tax=viral metagenome TaxID=1070528 RepID=A0A6C0BGQ5_9ZZZZ